jgi:hypothetical protein
MSHDHHTGGLIVNRAKRFIALFATLSVAVLGLAATSVLASSPAIAATASTGAAAAPDVAFDPQPGPPYVYSGYRFGSESACIATGRAFMNSGSILGYTCRYVAGAWRLYVIPGPPECGCTIQASMPQRLVRLG